MALTEKKLVQQVNKITVSDTIALSEGINKIEVGGSNQKGYESKRETLYITYQPEYLQPSKPGFSVLASTITATMAFFQISRIA